MHVLLLEMISMVLIGTNSEGVPYACRYLWGNLVARFKFEEILWEILYQISHEYKRGENPSDFFETSNDYIAGNGSF